MQSLYSLILNRIRNTYWILPTAIVLGAILLSVQITWIDSQLNLDPNGKLGWLLQNNPDGARAVLSTIAGSMITVAGVMLSSTIVVLTLASQQFGPRLVRNFIKDRPSQFVVGAFTGCFIYNILILKNIRSGDSDFVPQIALIVGVLQAILCIGLLIYFIQHISTTIQVQSIMDRVKCELDASVQRLFPEDAPKSPDQETLPEVFHSDSSLGSTIGAQKAGYIQAIRLDALAEHCQSANCFIDIQVLPGSFVIEGETLCLLSSNGQPSNDQISEICHLFVIGTFPTSEQDILFPVQQLEEMAIRALSPGINDPRTAIECLDHLTASLSILAKRSAPTPYTKDEAGQIRIRAKQHSFDTILREAYQQIHHYGRNDLQVVIRILQVFDKLWQQRAVSSERQQAIQSLAAEIYQKSMESMAHACDREKLTQFYAKIQPNESSTTTNT